MKSSILRSRLDNIEKDLLHSIYYHKHLIKEAEKKLKEIKKLKRIIK